METENGDIKGLVRRIFPKTVASSKANVCPSEEEISSFIDGKLNQRKEKNLICHLAECKDCLQTVKFLRQKPSNEEIQFPAWLDQKVKEIFTSRPKTLEIILGRVGPVFEIAKHTAELCLTIPELKMVPAAESFLSKVEKTPRSIKEEDEALVKGSNSSYVPGKFQKSTQTDFTINHRDKKGYVPSTEFLKGDGEDLYARKVEVRHVLENLKGQISKGFVFQERLGNYSVYLLLTKKEDKETIEVQIEIRDSIGQQVEDMEILFVQGRKVLEKLLTGKESHISRMLESHRSRIKFKHKGIYLGEAVLNTRK